MSTWEKKMNTYFNLYGKGGSEVSKQAYVDDFVSKVSASLPQEKVQQIKALRETLWTQLMGGKATSATVKKGDFVGNMEKLYKAAATMNTLRQTFSTFFIAVDTNNDNMIDPEEFAAILSLYGLGPDVAQKGFKAIDTNGDGLISREEFVGGFLDYYTTAHGGDMANLFGKV